MARAVRIGAACSTLSALALSCSTATSQTSRPDLPGPSAGPALQYENGKTFQSGPARPIAYGAFFKCLRDEAIASLQGSSDEQLQTAYSVALTGQTPVQVVRQCGRKYPAAAYSVSEADAASVANRATIDWVSADNAQREQQRQAALAEQAELHGQKEQWDRRVALDVQRNASDAYIKCLHDSVVAFALISPEPAETVVRAAIGSCTEKKSDMALANQRVGSASDEPFFDGLHKRLENQMIADVLATRAAAILQGTKKSDGTTPAAAHEY